MPGPLGIWAGPDGLGCLRGRARRPSTSPIRHTPDRSRPVFKEIEGRIEYSKSQRCFVVRDGRTSYKLRHAEDFLSRAAQTRLKRGSKLKVTLSGTVRTTIAGRHLTVESLELARPHPTHRRR